jgi:hypothetical protein
MRREGWLEQASFAGPADLLRVACLGRSFEEHAVQLACCCFFSF